MRQNRDILWKGVIEWVIGDLLRFVFPNADQEFDLDREITFLDQELAELFPDPNGKADVRYVDKLIKVFRKDGSEDWIAIHLEVQGLTKASERPFFGGRMFRYFYRCLDKYERPITSVAIFCGADQYELDDSYEYDYMGTSLLYKYNVIRISDYSDEELGQSTNPFAWVLLAAKHALMRGKNLDKRLLEGKLFIFRKLYENGLFHRENLQAVFNFVNTYVRFADPDNFHTFIEKVDEITHKNDTMDIFEASTLIRLQDQKDDFIKKLLKETDFSDEKIAHLVGVTVDFVEEVKEEMKQQ